MSLQNVKKGDTVVMLGFTGMRLGEFPVKTVKEKSIVIETKSGDKTFSKSTGKQKTEEGKERYANSIVTLDDAPKAKAKKDDKKAPKKADKKAKKEADEDDDDDDEEEAPKPKKSSAKKPAPKRPAKADEDDEDDDEDEDE